MHKRQNLTNSSLYHIGASMKTAPREAKALPILPLQGASPRKRPGRASLRASSCSQVLQPLETQTLALEPTTT